MLRSYFIIAWRNISRHKIYTVINSAGLALGLSAAIVIYLITAYELSFDTFHPDNELIYRIVGVVQYSNSEKHPLNVFPPPMPAAMHEEMSGLTSVAGLFPYDAPITIQDPSGVSRKFESRNEHGDRTTTFTGSSYFRIFHYEWLAGNEQMAMNDPFQVVLTENRAHQYFGSLPPEKIIGKEVIYNDSLHVQVSGIVKDWDGNTDFPLTDFISINTIANSFVRNVIQIDNWQAPSDFATIFIKREPGTSITSIDSQVNQFVRRHAWLAGGGMTCSLRLQPMSEIHFTDDFIRGDGDASHYDGDNFRKAHLPTLYGLIGGAVFILIIAIVNFVNLSTAVSLRRAREIGVRKVLGSVRKNLIAQFLFETLIQTLIAVCFAILCVSLIMSGFESFLPPGVRFDLFSLQTWLFLVAVTAATSILAGFYPATVLSSYQPAVSLRSGGGNLQGDKGFLRKGLIVFQFTISLIFITGSIVIHHQISFSRAELGFPSGTVINLWGGQPGKAPILAEKIRHLSGVESVALQGFPPIGMARSIRPVSNSGQRSDYSGVSMKFGDENFIPLYGLKLVAGRNFISSDSLSEFIVNRTYGKDRGVEKPEELLGRLIYFEGIGYPIIGVVDNFHESSPREAIGPIVIAHIPQQENNLVIRLGAGNHLSDILARIEKEWRVVYPDRSFNYSFLDEDIAWLLEKDRRSASLMDAVMAITIFISCMGIFGLATFAAQRRTKEIGIRKVLGATAAGITVLLGKELATLVLIATVLSCPIAWYFMDQWLQGFTYRSDLSWWLFVVAGLVGLAIALITISFQTIRAASKNPIESLKVD